MARQPQPTRPKHVPQRTCIACRRVAGKRSFVRVVRTAQGVEIDPTGKRAGRGAYLHPNHAESKAQLLAYMATLPSTDESLHALSPVDD
jgi:predicted RNA-binding protein YlxR (DUF448 family)